MNPVKKNILFLSGSPFEYISLAGRNWSLSQDLHVWMTANMLSRNPQNCAGLPLCLQSL